MYNRNIMVGLNWPTFFRSKNEKELKNLIERINKKEMCETDIGDILYMIAPNDDIVCDEIENGILKVVLAWCIEQSDFARHMLSEEEYLKVKDNAGRGQYNSKLCKKLLSKFHVVAKENENRDTVRIMFSTYLPQIREKAIENTVLKNYSALRNIVIKVASGVKAECYINTSLRLQQHPLTEKMNDYVIKKYNYDYNATNRGYENLYPLFKQLKTIQGRDELDMFLIEDSEVWESYSGFSLLGFLENVENLTSFTHACKIMDEIFKNIKANSIANKLIETSKRLVYTSKFALKNQVAQIALEYYARRFEVKNLSVQTAQDLVYPIFASDNNYNEKIQNGKECFQKFISDLYPENTAKISEIFELGGIKTPKDGAFYEDKSIIDLLDVHSYFLKENDVNKLVVEQICPEYFVASSVWNRVYLVTNFLESAYGKEEINKVLFEIFYNVFNMIECRHNIKSSFQLDGKRREEAYIGLKNKLVEFGLEINDDFKSDYIVSLLDRKFATIPEVEKFPELEQYGDAIYDLAVSELIFYNPTINTDDWNNLSQKFIMAETQTKIAKINGLDTFYIGNQIKDLCATNEPINNEQQIKRRHEYNSYIADAMEMIIATIARDKGVQIAIDFAKMLIKNADEELGFELKVQNAKARHLIEDVDYDYWTSIYPAPYSMADNNLYIMISTSLSKVMQCHINGTDTKEKRMKNAHTHMHAFFASSNFYVHGCVSPMLYDYLHKGIEFVLSEYADEV